MIKTILVATDGSEHACKAAALAGDLARQYGARLVLLHVLLRNLRYDDLGAVVDVKLPPAMQEELIRLAGEIEAAVAAGGIGAVAIPVMLPQEMLDEVARQVLDAAAGRAGTADGVQVDRVVDDGDPARLIVDHAERVGADMIVLGSRGLSDLKGLLVGSVSHKVSHLAGCTCVTVK